MENKRAGGSANGFFWGLLLGAGLTLLFTTKKGRKILKELGEAGVELVDNLSKLKLPEELYEEDLEEKVQEASTTSETREKPQNGEAKVKRFFKGIKKK